MMALDNLAKGWVRVRLDQVSHAQLKSNQNHGLVKNVSGARGRTRTGTPCGGGF